MTVDIITTNRLILRSTRDIDLNQLYDITFSVPEVMFYAFEGKPYSQKHAAEFFASSFDHDGNGKQLGVLTLKNADTIIGFAGPLECSIFGKPDYEIGFILGRSFWGKGYASEIGYAQIEYGFEVMGCRRLLALAAPKNEPSKAVLNKIGMTYHSTAETKDRGMREIFIIEP